MKQELLNGSPPNSCTECPNYKWITAEVFLRWFQKLLKFANASKNNPVLLLLDGYASHKQNLQVIDVAREYEMIISCFPPLTNYSQ